MKMFQLSLATLRKRRWVAREKRRKNNLWPVLSAVWERIKRKKATLSGGLLTFRRENPAVSAIFYFISRKIKG
ncbi:MAG: hypothetical protein AB1423_16530, partial [Pseudomonadota bacterium]